MNHASNRLEGLGGIPERFRKREWHDAPHQGEPPVDFLSLVRARIGCGARNLAVKRAGLTGRRDRDDDVDAQPGTEFTRPARATHFPDRAVLDAARRPRTLKSRGLRLTSELSPVRAI